MSSEIKAEPSTMADAPVAAKTWQSPNNWRDPTADAGIVEPDPPAEEGDNAESNDNTKEVNTEENNPSSSSGGSGGYRGHDPAVAEGRRIYVGNVHYATTPGELVEALKTRGFEDFEKIYIQKDPVTALNRGFCFVEFADKETADRALVQLRDVECHGRMLIVRTCGDSSSRQRHGREYRGPDRRGNPRPQARFPGFGGRHDGQQQQQSFGSGLGGFRYGGTPGIGDRFQQNYDPTSTWSNGFRGDCYNSHNGINRGAYGNHGGYRTRNGDGGDRWVRRTSSAAGDQSMVEEAATLEKRRLYVGRLPTMAGREDCEVKMRELFSKFNIETVSKPLKSRGLDGQPKIYSNNTYCFVDFDTSEAAVLATEEFNNVTYEGGQIKVGFGQGNSRRAAQENVDPCAEEKSVSTPDKEL